MSRYRFDSRRLVSALPPMICLALVIYFGWHAAEGERGLASLERLAAQAALAADDVAGLRQQRDALQRRVDLIRGPEVDGDLLEEEVRKLLGWTRENEFVILTDRADAD